MEQLYTDQYNRVHRVMQSTNYPHLHDHTIEVGGINLMFVIELTQLDLLGNRDLRFDVFAQSKVDHSRTEALCRIFENGKGEWILRDVHTQYLEDQPDEYMDLTEDSFINMFAKFIDIFYQQL